MPGAKNSCTECQEHIQKYQGTNKSVVVVVVDVVVSLLFHCCCRCCFNHSLNNGQNCAAC